ncbi:MAG: N-acetylmuramoyl-L-alanine amidase, partial [Alphaproteobacteria bacterium]
MRLRLHRGRQRHHRGRPEAQARAGGAHRRGDLGQHDLRILHHPSPNHGERRGGMRPRLVVLHHTAMAGVGAALARLCDPAAEVSAHWLIGADGAVHALVPEERRAWHAGAGAWGRVTDVNSASIGIELDNPGDRPFAAAQMRALETLLDAIMARWNIPPQGVIGHSDMAPGRKRDPGARFDWFRLARAGRSVWPPGAGGAPDPPRGSG